MSSIYTDQHLKLSDLLSLANNDQGATLLIPDLQRPYVWSPNQVVWLMDSLIRGWPFGTLLTWKVKQDDPIRELARPFWKVVDRTDGEDGETMSKKNPPAGFQMVLDGQQRVQSLLIAVSGDGWGFKLYDRDWAQALSDQRPRGRQGVKHWSLACLCVDLTKLTADYGQAESLASLDFTNILCWVVTGGNEAQSSYPKKGNYVEQVPRADRPENQGRYVRLSRLWESSPTVEGAEQRQLERMATDLLKEHDVAENHLATYLPSLASMLSALSRVKRTRVTFLEIAEFDPTMQSREAYNNAVVNIFTRLNTAGRTLTREDITFAWLKIGWQPAKTGNQGAADCFTELRGTLEELDLNLSTEELVAGVSFVWATAHNGGKLLSNSDLLKGDSIRPMARDVSERWKALTKALKIATAVLGERGFVRYEHYESLASVFVLWGWQYAGELWLAAHPCSELNRDAYEKSLAAALAGNADRWILCSQWAGRWSAASGDTIAGYAKRLAECNGTLETTGALKEAAVVLKNLLDAEVAGLVQEAITGLQSIRATRREVVRVYYAPLWIWHRLNDQRWKRSKLQLRVSKRARLATDVDHAVAFAVWNRKIAVALPSDVTDESEALALANLMGNCSLLEKNFNISKSDQTLESFLKKVHEIESGQVPLSDWSGALSFPECMLNPDGVAVDAIATAIRHRDELIRNDLVEFIRGTRRRVDLDDDQRPDGPNGENPGASSEDANEASEPVLT